MSTQPESFEQWMDRALYDPEQGYYRRAHIRTGRDGDFLTSVSTGELFGELLAWRAHDLWNQLDCPDCFHWVEQGAEDGHLLADVLRCLEQRWPDFARCVTPIVIEPHEPNREVQQKAVPKAWRKRAHWVAESAELPPITGMFFANELLDAFPARVFQRSEAGWAEQGVVEEGENRRWEAINTATPELPPGLDEDLPAPWQWEHQPGIGPWLTSLAARLERGVVLLIDYGFTEAELLESSRREGTLRGYFQHRQVRPLQQPAGQADLTVHLHWDELRAQAKSLGLREIDFREQGRYLTQLAMPLLQEIEAADGLPNSKLVRQLHSLLHPAHFGAKFQALEWER